MKTWMGLLIAFGLLTTFGAGRASAQIYGPPSRTNMPPILSPWLSMGNTGLPPAVNLYNLVQPQFEFRNALSQLQAQTTAEQQAIETLGQAAKLPATGHKVGFQTQARYFQTVRGFGTTPSGMRAGQVQARPQQPSAMPGAMPMMGVPFGR